MKLQYKLLLIFIVFLGFFIFNNNTCFGVSDPAKIPQEVIDYIEENYLDDYYNSYFVKFWSGTKYDFWYKVYIYNDSSFVVQNRVSSSTTEKCFSLALNLAKPTFKHGDIYFRYSDNKISTTNSPNIVEVTYSGDYTSGYYLYCPDSAYKNLKDNQAFYINSRLYTSDIVFFGGTYNAYQPNSSFATYEADKINLFELNLTDLDYNNTVHQFNLATYTDSPCYDEIMNYYNNDYQYSIYLTQYARFLTYDSEENMNFQHGSYVLSGYIDYLITDKSYFYFSPYYNKVLSNSGNNFFNKDVENYKKRFYFKLVYSEDSNSPNIEIWEDNGSLILGDVRDVAESDYFVGSSQTIYIANEKSNHDIKSLTNRFFYRGYLKRNDNDPVRNISDTPFYCYNFRFSGGANTIFYSSSADYNDQIDRLKYLLDTEYLDRTNFNNQVFNDENYYIEGSDSTTSTYLDNELTTDSTEEEIENTPSDKRYPTYNNKEDTSNWSILDFLRGIYNTLTFKESFDEDTGKINNSIALVIDKFSFKDNIVNNANEIKDYIVNTQETHKYYLNIHHKYLSGNVCVIDLSWYEPYKPTVDAFICAFAYLAFIWHMFCKIPELIRGASATSYVSEIQTYSNTGFGRSSNIHKGGF